MLFLTNVQKSVTNVFDKKWL